MKIFKKLIFSFILSFLICLSVNAETGYTTDKTGISFRSKPSTESNDYIITTIPYGVEFYISKTYDATGGGCAKGWHYAYYQGSYGYVCAGLVKIVGEVETTYNRPWTTPKKAIVGGADFISSGYISKGQNTSYLKKFNVNPNGFYAQFTHQYMANLRAPAGEAYTTFTSLSDNDLLNNAYNFLIPVYNDMPEQKYTYNGLYQVELPTAKKQDADFETAIKKFPSTYRPYLRYIHTLHSNWTFTPLKTNLDFNTVYLTEKAISSIEISSGYCEQKPYYITESGWCIANEDATKFFLDPRNFLTEKYIFMFEDLGYSDLYTASVVQSVLKNTFMSGKSTLDKQKYSSIFVEAGKNSKVSPLYLASLAIQEVGRTEGTTTSGKEFTYEGYTYKGLYNFFNIGAFSSESNPALAGLVWANGGKGVNNVVKTKTTKTTTKSTKTTDDSKQKEEDSTKNVEQDFITMLKAIKPDKYLIGYDVGTKVDTIKNNVGTNATVKVLDSDGNKKKNSAYIGTGDTIEISNKLGNEKFTYVMYGDLNGDGEINSGDLLKMRQHLLGISKLSGAFKSSAYLNGDNEINSGDLLKMRQHLLGTNKINQR